MTDQPDPVDSGNVGDLGDLEYDLSSRHVLVARLINALVPPGPILDIGGSEGMTQSVLPDRRVVSIDILPTSVDVIASGDALPFPDGVFAGVVALDVLEHVPGSVKEGLVDEACRLGDVVILAGPYDDEAVREAERQQRQLFRALFGEDHRWLEEHAASGLPDLAATETRMQHHGLSTTSFGSNPLELWAAQLLNSHVALRVGFNEKTLGLRRQLLETFLDRADATPPSYRHILVGARRDDVAEVVARLTPGSDPAAVEPAVRATEEATATVINHGFGVVDKLRQDAMDGWAGSIDRIHALEERMEELGELPDERTVAALEEVVFENEGWRSLLAGPPVQVEDIAVLPDPAPYQAWRAARAVRAALAARPIPSEAVGAGSGPMFSVITPVFNPDPAHLTACIRSVRAQTYGNWELVLVDVSTAPPAAQISRRYSLLDSRVIVVNAPNEGIAANTNAGAAVARGEWICFLDHDDVLAPHALATVAARIAAEPSADLIYSDEDKLDVTGAHDDPLFKPDWSPDLLRTLNYIGHFVAVRRPLFDAVDGLRHGFDGAQDYDFLLRATHQATNIQHIADVLYSWRRHPESTASDVRVKPAAHSASRRALQDFARRHVPGAWVEPGPGPTAHRLRYQLSWDLVSVIVPFKDNAKMTNACVEAIDRCRSVLPVELLLVSNNSTEPETFEYMETWERNCDWVRVLEYNEPYHFQKLNNWAVRQTTGKLLMFLNNDTEPLHEGWLEALAEHALRDEIGAVGGRLFYPNGLVQHAGVVVGIGGFAEHPWAHLHPDAWTPAGPSYWVRDVLAVTAAAMMIERKKFELVGGFDERFQVCGGDVDLCLRLHDAGLRNIMTPFARIVHYESASRERQPPENDIRESQRAYSSWLASGDPYYNRNLTLLDTSCSIATS